MSEVPFETATAAPVVVRRLPWVLPRLAELPKLTALTLASAIGGTGGTGSGGSTVFGILLAALLLNGCAADQLLAPSAERTPRATVAVTCHANVAQGAVTCGEGPQASSGVVILGGQGLRVVLRSSNVAYDAINEKFSVDVSVQNLSSQLIGSPDGITPTGVDVFFVTAPTAVPGPATITLDNAAGPALFNGTSQYYFHYPQQLATQETTPGLPWIFGVAADLDFTFTVLVSAEVPDQDGILQWRKLGALNKDAFVDVAANSANDAMAVGVRGATTRWDGTGVTRLVPITDEDLLKVAALGSGKYVAVGTTGGMYRFDGKVWSKVFQLPTPTPLYDVYASSDSFIIAVGPGNHVVYSGGTYFEASGTGTELRYVSGFDNSVWAMTADGQFYIRGGGSFHAGGGLSLTPFQSVTDFQVAEGALTGWSIYDVSTHTGSVYVAGSPVYVRTDTIPVGFSFTGGDTVVVAVMTPNSGFPGSQLINVDLADPGYRSSAKSSLRFNSGLTGLMRAPDNSYWASNAEDGFIRYVGGNYTLPDQTPAAEYRGVWGTGNTAWIVTNTYPIWRLQDGDLATGDVATPTGLRSIWGFSATDLYGGADDGTIWHGDGSGFWTQDPTPVTAGGVESLWGDPVDGTLWAVVGGNVFARLGGTWTLRYNSFPNPYHAVWGCNANDVWAVSDKGFMAHFVGGTFVGLLRYTGEHLRAVTGTACDDVWVAGDAGSLFHWDGTGWTTFHDAGMTNFRSLSARARGEVYAGGSNKVLLVTTGGGSAQLSLPTAFPIDGLWATSNGELIAVGENTVLVGSQ